MRHGLHGLRGFIVKLICVICVIRVPFLLSQLRGSASSSPIGIQITGYVRYGNGNGPAENVLVRLEAAAGGVVGDVQTDRSGKFMFTGLSGQEYNITVIAAGYQQASEHVDLKTLNSAFVQMQLMPDNRGSAASSKVNTEVVN